MANEITVTLDITLAAQAAEGFASMGGEALKATKEFPGCLDVRILRHKDDRCRFLFVERWESEDAYRAYIAFRTERGEFQSLQKMATSITTDIWPTVVAAI